MLFNSYEFLFLFLPLTLIGFFLFARIGSLIAIGWLVLASLFFYAWYNPAYLILILFSMVVNYAFGQLLSATHRQANQPKGRMLLMLGVTLNLCGLAYFKYAGFLVDNFNLLIGGDVRIHNIVLPLAISFFTFQQIAYLVDSHRGLVQEYRLSHYALFVTFFPQLIAGPIVHHREMLPQFMRAETLQPRLENISVGMAIFTIGLFKKTVLADSAANYSSPVFDAASAGETLTFFEAWGGALSYTMQLYFDFSGYSDMAIGAARLFGVRLPLNFHSPYKATNIIEFWRRWHMTLSRFLRDYVYIALGGNRSGKRKRYINLMITMLLGGLWHGAGWTFVIWGGLHGFYLIVNHAWSQLSNRLWPVLPLPQVVSQTLGWLVTFLAVVVGWVFFRATDFSSAMTILAGMGGANGIALPNAVAVQLGGLWDLLAAVGVTTYLGGGNDFVFTWLWLAFLIPVALIMPNTQQIMARFEPALRPHQSEDRQELIPMSFWVERVRWQPTAGWGITLGIIAALGVLSMSSISEFLYFQF